MYAKSMKLELPDSIVQGMKIPEPELNERLLQELAIGLYAQKILSFGKALELSGMERLEFQHLLSKREIERHYTEDDLEQDIDYARGQ